MIRWRDLTRHVDWTLLTVVFILLAAGLLLVFSSTQPSGGPARYALFEKQLLWVGIGLMVMCIAAVIPFGIYDGIAPFLYPVSVLMLLVVLFAGEQVFGARRWILLGPMRFQPSELSKFALIIVLSRFYSKPRINMNRPQNFILPLAISFVPALLILKEPDLGSALSVVFIFIVMSFWAGTPRSYLLLLATPIVGTGLGFITPVFVGYIVILGLFLYRARLPFLLSIPCFLLNILLGIGGPVVWRSMEMYQRERILTFMDPGRDPFGAGYQVIQSKIAIGSGGVLGKGFLHGTQKALSFLPAQHTDFIFSVLGEELGLWGTVLLVGVFLVLFLRCIGIAVRSPSRLGSFLVVGATASILYNAVVNTWMTVGLAPVTGIPLPFISYGGSSLITTLSLMGLVFNVHLRRHEF